MDTTDKKILIDTPQLLEQPVLHLPAVLRNTNRRRCALCKINNKDRKARFECNSCNVGLCLNTRKKLLCIISSNRTLEIPED